MLINKSATEVRIVAKSFPVSTTLRNTPYGSNLRSLESCSSIEVDTTYDRAKHNLHALSLELASHLVRTSSSMASIPRSTNMDTRVVS